MKLNLLLVLDELQLPTFKQELYGRQEHLDLLGYQIYQCEKELKDHTLYLCQSEWIQSPITGSNTAALLILGVPNDITLCAGIPWASIDSNTVDFLVLCNQVNQLFFRYQEMENALEHAVYAGKSFQDMVDIFSPCVHNEMIMMNSDFYLLAHTYETIHLYQISGLEQYDTTKRLPMENLDFFKNDAIYAQVRDEKEPFIYKASIYACDVMCMNTFYQGEFVCRIVICEIETPFRPYDKALIKYFTGYVQEVYNQTDRKNITLGNSAFSEMLCDLLCGKNVEQWLLSKNLVKYKWDQKSLFQCVCLLPSEQDFYNNTISYYCQLIIQQYPMTCAFEYSGYIICIVNLKEYHYSEEEFFSKFVFFLRDSYFQAGFSNTFTELEKLSYYFKQSEIALTLGQRLHTTEWYHKFQELLFPYMQEKICSEFEPEMLCAKELLVLKNYDKENHTDYFLTLKTYLQQNMNAVATAKILFIHRATMMYRLKRIKEITNLNLNDMDQVLYLLISYRFLTG